MADQPTTDQAVDHGDLPEVTTGGSSVSVDDVTEAM